MAPALPSTRPLLGFERALGIGVALLPALAGHTQPRLPAQDGYRMVFQELGWCEQALRLQDAQLNIDVRTGAAKKNRGRQVGNG